MPFCIRSKRAPRPGALFVFGCLLGIALPVTARDCPVPGDGEPVRVARVYDGDTVKLADGRRLRLIGVNAPETGHGNLQPQPLAAEARAMLESLLDRQNHTLTFHHGTKQHDHYGRLLAHALLEDGSNLAVQLLERGLATALAVPPNTSAADCYSAIEHKARLAGLGIWSLPRYRAVAAAELTPDERGFRLVEGLVSDIRQSRYSIWLQLDGPLAAHIARRDLVHFPGNYPQVLLGQRVELRGWLKPDREGLKINIRHPAALAPVDSGTD